MKEMTKDFEKQPEMMSPYATQISTTMVRLGEAVGMALNLRDAKVIEEMKKVAMEIFEAAEAALKNAKVNLN